MSNCLLTIKVDLRIEMIESIAQFAKIKNYWCKIWAKECFVIRRKYPYLLYQ